MAIDQVLIDLVRSVNGAKGAIVIASDGEAIAWCAMNDDSLRLRGAYLSLALKSLTDSRTISNLGKIELTIFDYQGASFVVQRLDDETYLAVELHTSANISEAAFRMNPAVAELRRQLAL